jgi:hypothetical protein
MRNKLDILGNVTSILETQNIEEVENRLNHELTKLKLANESLVSQRTILNNQIIPTEEYEKFGSRELPTDNRMMNPDIDRTQIQHSDLFSNQNGFERKNIPCNYKDSTLQLSHDLTMSMNIGREPAMTAQHSRNLITGLQKNSSTKDKFDHQQSLPSANQFTLTNNQLVITRQERMEKPKKIQKSLFEDFKNRDVIEEEKKQEASPTQNEGTHIPNRIYREESSDEEEEKKQNFPLKPNAFMENESGESGGKLSKVENLTKVQVKRGLINNSNQRESRR